MAVSATNGYVGRKVHTGGQTVAAKKSVSSSEDKEQRYIQSILVGFRLIRVLQESGTKLSLKRLAQLADMSPSNAHLYLVSFGRLGLVVQDPITTYYGLGPYAIDLGLAAIRQLDVADLARGPLEALSEEFGQSVYLSVWANKGPTIILKFDSHLNVPLAIRMGYVLPLATSATGQVFLAHLGEREVEPILKQEIPNAAQRGKRVAEVRQNVLRDGVGLSDSVLYEGFGAIAAPVFDHDNRITASITVLGPSNMLNVSAEAPMAKAVVAAADKLTRSLRGGSAPN
jgi:DNA-binding IclR family transcriptional regulator